MSFDPESTLNSKNGIFGLPFTPQNSQVILLPIPWDVTASYGKGAYKGPQSILQASPQIDLYDIGFKEAYKQGFHMLSAPKDLVSQNDKLNLLSAKIQNELEENSALTEDLKKNLEQINQASKKLEEEVYKQAISYIQKNKIFGIIGGDHSCPLGAIKAYIQHYKGDLSLLHIDAHADLRNSYQGFEQSHASIMFNAIQNKPKSLTQVGIRDFCQSEYKLMTETSNIHPFFDSDLKENQFKGIPWHKTCEKIIESVSSQQVYISFDIDGLSPDFCPNTGTPVPGGLSYDQAQYLIKAVANSGKTIVGFDLCEVTPGNDGSEWDANVGARILYQLCGWSCISHNSSAPKSF